MDSRRSTEEKSVSAYRGGYSYTPKNFLNDEQRFSERIFLVIDALSGQVLDASAAALRFYGYSFERITSMKITEINTLPYFVVMKKRLDAARKPKSNFIFPHRLADGRVKDVEVISSVLIMEGRKCLLSEIKDITENNLATG
ncbi:PAS domain S-box protein [Geovibrio thiophilus]|uniref:PAS domain S-box protein n=1 Tax=Geovibrio thiophilus TaxID=139438 RepID=A0A3R5Y786_9BACT|nr:PAS domain-containing protein [Geovibrio thiophilus]QAR33394.1 PAS domain S-box protein [Geovibrio thiophilus]